MKEQAFPLVEPVNSFDTVHPGMTLRDWFAGQIIGHLSALDNTCTVQDCCTEAYRYADAMLAEREKGHVSD